MRLLTSTSTLDDLTGSYGRDWRSGVISEHLTVAEAAGMVVHTSPSGAVWLHEANGGRAARVLCSELIMVATEDGPVSGRCGRPIVGRDSWGCEAHEPDPQPEPFGFDSWDRAR